MKKSNMLQKSLFLIIFTKKKRKEKFCEIFFIHFFRYVQIEEKNVYDLYWILIGKFFGPYQYTKFSLINSGR